MPLGLHTTELNFETIKEIGQEGKNSQVFLAHDKQLDGEIVIKKIEKNKITNADEYYAESKKLYASSHSNVVRVNYGCSDADHIYIAMPYYAKGSLKYLASTRLLTIREVLRYSIQFLSGLYNIHSKGLIHFDIKPDNILISDSDEALLSDFGLSKAMNTLGYADPDQIYEKQVPPEVFLNSDKTLLYDIYLCGLTLYRLLNGENIFMSQLAFDTLDQYQVAILSGKFPSRNLYLPHIPLKLQRIVNKALNVNLSERHQSVLQLINEMSEVDENLDWQYSVIENVENWSKNNGIHTINIAVDFADLNSISILTTKTNNSSGSSMRITSHCHDNLVKSNVGSKIKAALKL